MGALLFYFFRLQLGWSQVSRALLRAFPACGLCGWGPRCLQSASPPKKTSLLGGKKNGFSPFGPALRGSLDLGAFSEPPLCDPEPQPPSTPHSPKGLLRVPGRASSQESLRRGRVPWRPGLSKAPPCPRPWLKTSGSTPEVFGQAKAQSLHWTQGPVEAKCPFSRSKPPCIPDFPKEVPGLPSLGARGKETHPCSRRFSLSTQAHGTPEQSPRRPAFLATTQMGTSSKAFVQYTFLPFHFFLKY